MLQGDAFPELAANRSRVREVIEHTEKTYLKNKPPGKRVCTGVFISKLEPQYTPKHIEEYVWQQASEKVRVRKMQSKRSTSSFYIPCKGNVRESLYGPELLA